MVSILVALQPDNAALQLLARRDRLLQLKQARAEKFHADVRKLSAPALPFRQNRSGIGFAAKTI